MRICALIPAFNEAPYIAKVVEGARQICCRSRRDRRWIDRRHGGHCPGGRCNLFAVAEKLR